MTEVTVVNRTLDRAASLVEALQPHVPQTVFTAVQWGDPGLGEAFARAKLLVNSTSVGMSAIEGEESWTQALLTFKQLPLDRLATDAFFYDLVYEPKTTPFMALGMAAGHGVQNGLGMLIHQGAEAFRIWTRRDPPIDVMRNAVNQARSDS